MQLIDDEATSRFLETARADLQRRLGVAGEVALITAEETGRGIRLVAWVRLGSRAVTFTGSGDSLVTAFGALTRAAAAPPPAPHPFAWR